MTEHSPLDFPQGTPIWADLLTSDAARAEEFYGGVLGWRFEHTPDNFGGYINIFHGEDRVAGMMAKDAELADAQDVWTVYLASDDAPATLEAVSAAGGQISMPVTEVGELGRMAMVLDSTGASLGIWEPGSHAGFGALMTPGSPHWFELHTRDYEGAKTFYAKTFGVEIAPMSETPEFRYSTFGEGQDAKAGLMDAADFLPEGLPSNWQVYWGVENADEALAAVTRLGGSVLQDAEDTPFGRIAAAADPFGAPFKIAQAL